MVDHNGTEACRYSIVMTLRRDTTTLSLIWCAQECMALELRLGVGRLDAATLALPESLEASAQMESRCGRRRAGRTPGQDGPTSLRLTA